VGTEPVDFCREIEAHLCRKNDGHLIRITGPSFDLVSAWAQQGVPLKVACAGIDRYFERYYAKGPRRRPIKIDFCEADVLDVFDEWRRATGVTALARSAGEQGVPAEAAPQEAGRPTASLPSHLERALRRLTSARATGALDASFDDFLDRVAREFDRARGLRGDKRQALVDRLAALDRELLNTARAALDADARSALAREADDELAAFRAGMSAEAIGRAREAAIDRLVRERMKLPTLAYY
jgi:hypothetical protein